MKSSSISYSLKIDHRSNGKARKKKYSHHWPRQRWNNSAENVIWKCKNDHNHTFVSPK